MHICLYDRFTSLGTNSDGIYMKNLHMYVQYMWANGYIQDLLIGGIRTKTIQLVFLAIDLHTFSSPDQGLFEAFIYYMFLGWGKFGRDTQLVPSWGTVGKARVSLLLPRTFLYYFMNII
jgi:hypothetical protein